MAEHPINGLMGVTMDKIRELVNSDTIIGEPVSLPDGTTILPVSKVTFGVATGGSDFAAKQSKELFGGGHARLYLSDEANVLESGIEIEVSPPGKVIKNLSALSGGEQALVAISIYFAILRVNPAPFCFLDEIEAALDDVNVARYAQYLRRMTDRTQFIVITHRRGTMEAADVLYGVTMQERGVSRILTINLNDMAKELNIK